MFIRSLFNVAGRWLNVLQELTQTFTLYFSVWEYDFSQTLCVLSFCNFWTQGAESYKSFKPFLNRMNSIIDKWAPGQEIFPWWAFRERQVISEGQQTTERAEDEVGSSEDKRGWMESGQAGEWQVRPCFHKDSLWLQNKNPGWVLTRSYCRTGEFSEEQRANLSQVTGE